MEDDIQQKIMSASVAWKRETDAEIQEGTLTLDTLSPAEIHLYRQVEAHIAIRNGDRPPQQKRSRRRGGRRH